MNSKNALIVMSKNPVLGECKTRLASTTGKEKALDIYVQLLDYTAQFIKEVEADKFIYTTNPLKNKQRWESENTHFRLQSQGDLGERMNNAILDILKEGYDKVVLIGSDCAEINSDDIHTSFEQLNTYNTTLGPALDGGYYLIGMKKVTPSLFKDITWSTPSVLKDTISKINSEGLTFSLLEVKSDIDVEADLKRKGYINFNQ